MRTYFKRAIKGYNDEALHGFLIKLLICTASLFICFVVDAYHIASVVVVFVSGAVIVELFSILTFYNLAVIIRMDIKFNKMIEKNVVLEEISKEKVEIGKYGGDGGSIHNFYPKRDVVRRYKITCVTDNYFSDIRVVLGYKKMELLKQYIENNNEPETLRFNVKYLKFSKVLYDITPCCVTPKDRKLQQDLIDSVFVLEKPVGILNGFKREKNKR